MVDKRRTHSRRHATVLQMTLDPLIHSRMRLAIVSALAGGQVLSFGDLKRLLGTTDGNLSVHARKLERAGYITCHKGFQARTPKTEYRLTEKGRRAFEAYIDHMDRILEVARKKA